MKIFKVFFKIFAPFHTFFPFVLDHIEFNKQPLAALLDKGGKLQRPKRFIDLIDHRLFQQLHRVASRTVAAVMVALPLVADITLPRLPYHIPVRPFSYAPAGTTVQTFSAMTAVGNTEQ